MYYNYTFENCIIIILYNCCYLLVLEAGPPENTMTIDGTQIKIEASTSGNENITDIQNYLDSFNKEIEGNEVTQVQTGL